MKKNHNIYEVRCENIEDEQFENLLEEDLIDIEDFLDSYVVSKVDEKSIDSTIEVLKSYMPQEEVETVNKYNIFLQSIKNNISLIKLQLNLINKPYFLLALLLSLVGTITVVKLNLSIYMSSFIIAPIPILLGIFEIIKGRDDNVWELELSYKYSLREIIFSRLIIINAISVLISLVISISLSNIYSQINLLKMISIWLIPIFTTASISLIITSVYRSMNSITLCIVIWILSIASISIYEKMGYTININTLIVLIVSITTTVISSRLFYKNSINIIDYKTSDF